MKAPRPLWLELLAALLILGPVLTKASLEDYDQTVTQDAAAGLVPLARLSSAIHLSGSDRVPFNFGNTSGDATLEFILEGDPEANVGSYLAVGENAHSNLRYELWFDTGQLGFTELGVLDYTFDSEVPSPTEPTPVAYVWNDLSTTMELYLNGALTGSRSGVNASFAMPHGEGWLGANPSGGEAMVGSVYRVTVYPGRVSSGVILAHANAFRSVVDPPTIVSFTSSAPVLFTPGTATLRWEVRNALEVRLDEVNVTGQSEQTVSPTGTHTYRLIATNAGASNTAELTIVVNPPPVVLRFGSDQTSVAPGGETTLRWTTQYAETVSIAPGIGDVTARTVDGVGSILIQPSETTTYEITARSGYGTQSASVTVHRVQSANHLVISEFMANDESTLPDENGKFSGWIEIYNPTSQTVALQGYSLTDDPTDLRQWSFPPVDLLPGAYLVVFASGNDRRQPGLPLHTNFRLADAGEFLGLIAPGGGLVHSFPPAFPPQRPGISYGLLGGDTNQVQFFGKPTPGAPNDPTAAPPAAVQLSTGNRVFRDPFAVSLTAGEASAQIYFTLDGSPPGLTNGYRYQTPIQITNTTHLRAVAVAGDKVGSISGASYIRLAQELVGYTSSLPILVVENFGAGKIPQKGWNSTGSGIKQVPRQAAAWATFELNGGVSAFADAPQMFSLIGIRGRGAYSTEWRQKPYSVEVIDETGAEAKTALLGMPAHADWVLYFPDPDQNRDPTLLFNTFAYELSRQMGRYAVRFRWVEAFVNEDGGELKLADRRGVYAVLEKVARGKDRLDFQALAPDGSSGSWLLNINRMDPVPETGWPAPNGATRPWFFHTAGPNRILETKPNTAYGDVPGDDLPQQSNGYLNFDNPNGYVISTNQRAAIEGWLEKFEDALYNDALWLNPTNGYRQYLDTRDFTDYFILNVLTRNGDGLLISMFPWKGDDNKLRMGPAWDYNWASYYISGGPTGALMHRAEQLWYPRLFSDPDFQQGYIDRWWELRRGPLSNVAMGKIIDDQAAEITPGKAALNGLPSAVEWTRRLRQMKDWLTQRADWMDSNYLRPPTFSRMGGEVAPGFNLLVSGTGGTIYVTTDGTDPRGAGGRLSGGARVYAGPVIIQAQTVVQARIKNGGTWSGLTRAFFSTAQDLTRLAVTEIMYDPLASAEWAGEDLEFLELQNTGTNVLQLGGLEFTSGIVFAFPEDAQLEPGAFYLLGRNPAAITATYPGIVLNGVYTGKLNNDGETLRLASVTGTNLFDFTYQNQPPWPPAAAGLGFSLVPREGTIFGSSNPADWRSSAAMGGSPGRADPPPVAECLAGRAPAILQDPLSQTVVAGGLVGFSVEVTNTAALPITYRWQRNGEDVPGGTVVLERHRAFLSVALVQLPYTNYTVHVSNPACPTGFTSANAILSFLTDTDQDGQPDTWESAFGLDPRNPSDRDEDSDGDGLTNNQEYLSGTNPKDPTSCLKLEVSFNENGSGARIKVRALANRTYRVESTDSLVTPQWASVEEIVAQTADRDALLVDPAAAAKRFYRVVTPSSP